MAYCLINKSNYFHNLSKIEEKISKDKIAVVIKNNAYGHGLKEIAELASEYGIRHAVVNNSAEANMVYSLFDSIIVLQDTFQNQVNENIIITINSIDSINKIASNTKVELKVDTGMNRNGVMLKDFGLALDLIVQNKLTLNGVFTHFSNAYLEDDSLIQQKDKFDKIKQTVLNDQRFSDNNIRFHCCASSSLFRINNNEYDLARVGIMSYGYVALPDTYAKPPLKPVLSLWANKITTKSISEGDSVGYGQVFRASEDMIVSTYDIGYGDGFMRLDGDKTENIEDGREILGVVSMNSFSTSGDDKEVCVFENAERFSNIHGTIVYEVISNINPNLKRIIV